MVAKSRLRRLNAFLLNNPRILHYSQPDEQYQSPLRRYTINITFNLIWSFFYFVAVPMGYLKKFTTDYS